MIKEEINFMSDKIPFYYPPCKRGNIRSYYERKDAFMGQITEAFSGSSKLAPVEWRWSIEGSHCFEILKGDVEAIRLAKAGDVWDAAKMLSWDSNPTVSVEFVRLIVNTHRHFLQRVAARRSDVWDILIQLGISPVELGWNDDDCSFVIEDMETRIKRFELAKQTFLAFEKWKER